MESPSASFLSRSWSWSLSFTGKRKSNQIDDQRDTQSSEDEAELILRRPSKRRNTAPAEELDGPESTANKQGHNQSSTSTSALPDNGEGNSGIVEQLLLTPLKRLVPRGKAFVSALFSVPGDMHCVPPSPFSSSSSAARPASPMAAQPRGSVPPSPSPSSPPDTDSIYIDLTVDDDDELYRSRTSPHLDRSSDVGIHEVPDYSVEDKNSREEEKQEEEHDEEEGVSAEQQAEEERKLEEERALADREWREGPLAAAIRDTFASTSPPRPRAPDLLYEMRRLEEREAFRGSLQGDRRARTTQSRRDRANRSAHSRSASATSTSILDSFAEEAFMRSPPPDLRHRPITRYEEEVDKDVEHRDEEEDNHSDDTGLASSMSALGLEHIRMFWTSLAKFESRKLQHERNIVHHRKAIDGSLGRLQQHKTSFEKALAQLRAEEERRRLEKARAKWLAEDRRPLTPEEQAAISRAMRGRATEVLVTGFNAELTRQDLQRLRDTEWLNDEVINFYLNLLKQRSDKRTPAQAEWPKCHFLNTFFYPLLSDKGGYNYSRVQKWTRRVDLFAMDRVIVPIHLGNHWCLAVINMQARRFEYYDSLGSSNTECLQRLRQYLQDEARDKKAKELDLSDWEDYQPKDIPMQKNGYDCGVFACKFAECISSARPFYFSQVDMPLYRKRMIVSILTKTLT